MNRLNLEDISNVIESKQKVYHIKIFKKNVSLESLETSGHVVECLIHDAPADIVTVTVVGFTLEDAIKSLGNAGIIKVN